MGVCKFMKFAKKYHQQVEEECANIGRLTVCAASPPLLQMLAEYCRKTMWSVTCMRLQTTGLCCKLNAPGGSNKISHGASWGLMIRARFLVIYSRRGPLTWDKPLILCSRWCAAWSLVYISWGVGLSRPQPCGTHIYNTNGHVSVAIVHPHTMCYCTTGNMHGFFLVVGPVSAAVCALGLWYGLWLGHPWHVYALWLVISYYVFHVHPSGMMDFYYWSPYVFHRIAVLGS